jgi:hypothetical protein
VNTFTDSRASIGAIGFLPSDAKEIVRILEEGSTTREKITASYIDTLANHYGKAYENIAIGANSLLTASKDISVAKISPATSMLSSFLPIGIVSILGIFLLFN